MFVLITTYVVYSFSMESLLEIVHFYVAKKGKKRT